jgi:hypothetical protein
MAVRIERYVGSDCTGSDGGTNRVLTISNIGLTSDESFSVYVQGIILSLDVDYTVVHANTGTAITFINNIFDDSYIIVNFEEAIQSSSVVYCTASDVGSFINNTFSSVTDPTTTEVESFIAENEDYIDNQTNHAWRSKTITEETHHLEKPAYQLRDGIQVFLNHRKIRTFSSASGDKLEVWNGSTWEDFILNRAEGREKDYWVDYQMGILFIKSYALFLPRNFGVRVTYRFGETSVPKDIKKACKLLTAVDLTEGDDRSILFPEGTSNIPLPDKARRWTEEAEKIISRYKEMVVGGL